MSNMSIQQVQRDISHYLMRRYNWIQSHQFNEALTPAQTEKKLKILSGIGCLIKISMLDNPR